MAAFEEDFAHYCEREHAIGVANGTDALYLALRAMRRRPGRRGHHGGQHVHRHHRGDQPGPALPVFVDIDPITYRLDPATLEAAITPRTKAIVPVHLYGQPADMDPIMTDRRAARAARARGRLPGARAPATRAAAPARSAHIGCLQLLPRQEPRRLRRRRRMVTNDDRAGRARLRMLRESRRARQVRSTRSRAGTAGSTPSRRRCSASSCATSTRWNAARRAIAARYDERLAGLPGVTTPTEAGFAEGVYHLYA